MLSCYVELQYVDRLYLFSLLAPLPPISIRFPYTTLFRSALPPPPDEGPSPRGEAPGRLWTVPDGVGSARAHSGGTPDVRPGQGRDLRPGHRVRTSQAVTHGRGKQDRKSTSLNSSHVASSYA